MKPLPLIVAGLLTVGILSPCASGAESVVFEIGMFDGNQAEFEQESGLYNDAHYYWEAGDYLETMGRSGGGTIYEEAGPEILQDGPTAETWADTLDGFPRALVPGRPIIDIFFQMTSAEAESGALLFETELMGLGGGSSHDVVFYLNNVPVHRVTDVRENRSVKFYITPARFPDLPFIAGSNVFSAQRTGGGADNPWIQFDALRLTAGVTAPPEEQIWQIGYFDNNQADFEQETDAFNDPRYYTMAGDYSEVTGLSGSGIVWEGPDPEIWQDASGDWAETLDGFPRALVPGRPIIDIFFQLTPAQASRSYLAFSTTLFGLGTNSSHNVKFYLNGKLFHVGANISRNTPIDALIPRLGLLGEGIGAPFHAGGNVLSIERVGGAPFDPAILVVLEDGREAPANDPWIQFDALRLEAVAAPATPAPLFLGETIFAIGRLDNNQADFEQESDAYNNPQYYAAPGDYTAVIGKATTGASGVWEGPDAEIWQDPNGNPAETLDGFPRALVPGRPVIDIFFQLDAKAQQARRLTFFAPLFWLGGGSSHDIEFYVNGTPFFSQANIIRDWGVGATFDRSSPDFPFVPGPNVISLVRTGGGETDPWIQFDTVQLLAEYEYTSVSEPPAAAGFAITSVARAESGAVTLIWESVTDAEYRVETSPSLAAASWTPLASNVAGQATSTTWTDSPIPAGTLLRYYRVVRTR